MEQYKITTATAIQQLSKALKGDSEYYDSWRANIAMSIYDAYVERIPNAGAKSLLLDIFSDGADRFLRLLTAEKTTDNE